LIVFFAAIREILKREIYRGDKKISLADENKEQREPIAFSFE
jgi:hypothetical protein